MFALLKRIKSLSLPPDIALKLLKTLVKPVVLYGAEVWGCENVENDLLFNIYTLRKRICSILIGLD